MSVTGWEQMNIHEKVDVLLEKIEAIETDVKDISKIETELIDTNTKLDSLVDVIVEPETTT